jgi:uncharacterized protein
LLDSAVKEGNIEVLQKLLRLGAKIEKSNGENQTPLFLAVMNGDIDIVEILLKAGADPN